MGAPGEGMDLENLDILLVLAAAILGAVLISLLVGTRGGRYRALPGWGVFWILFGVFLILLAGFIVLAAWLLPKLVRGIKRGFETLRGWFRGNFREAPTTTAASVDAAALTHEPSPDVESAETPGKNHSP